MVLQPSATATCQSRAVDRDASQTDETEDAEDLPDLDHRDAVGEREIMWYFNTASSSHVTGNRANVFNVLSVENKCAEHT